MFPTQQNSPPSNPSLQSEKRVKKTLSIVDPSTGRYLTNEILHTKESKGWGSSHRSTSSSGPDSGSRGTPSMTHEIPKESSVADVAEKGDVYGFLADSVKLKSFLSCEKCREEFDKDRKQPLLLPCLNAMCKQCISNVWASHNTSFKCSVCQRVHVCYENESIVLPLDGTRKAALEISHLISGESGIICEMCTNDQLASHRCFDCSYFICSDCTKLHSSLRTFKCHSYTSIKNLFEGEMRSLSMFSNTTYCPVSGHDKEMMKMFCRTESCMKPVCVICAISAHKNHIICDIAEVANEKRKKIQKLKKSVQLREKQSQVSLAQLSEMNETNFSESERIQKEITACFSKAKAVLDKRRDELCNAVARQQNVKEELIGMERTRLSKFVESCLQACLYVDNAPVINKHPSLYNISKSMEMRLEDLESQSPGCEVTVTLDTMKFIPKELDSTFEKSAASFGELMNTKAFSKRSKAMIKPSVCYVGQEITFQITLVSLLGNKIHDEQVHVYLNLQGENFKIIQCPFEKSSSSFVGKWIPDMAMELSSWKVVSNGIEMETLKGTLQIKENCATAYEKAMQAQVAVKTGGGRNRRRFVTDGSDSRPSSSNTDKFGDTLEVKTKEGLIVKVYQESIKRLKVDCIVNAANEYLSHGGGVSRTISEAAGYTFDQESMEYIRKYGQIPVGECCVTGAGNLPYQYVIHTVGPRWFNYREDEKKDCLDDLQRAVEVTFKKAEELGLSSIALPAISSGIFGIPKDKCVEQYYRAVVSFSGSNKCYCLREIHFVDRDHDMVEKIKASFNR